VFWDVYVLLGIRDVCIRILLCFRFKIHKVFHILDDDEDVDLLSADLYILPPTGRHDDTDGDSGDDNVPDGDPNNLNYHQLIAEAAVRLRKPDGDIHGLDDDFDALEESDKCKTGISRRN